MLSDRLSSS